MCAAPAVETAQNMCAQPPKGHQLAVAFISCNLTAEPCKVLEHGP
jgi:hypothetical protein